MLNHRVVTGICLIVFLLWSAISVGDVQPRTLQELQNFYPQVNDKANAALVYQKAIESFVRSDYNDLVAIIWDNQPLPSVPVVPLEPEIKKAIEKELERNSECLKSLHQASLMKRCRYPLDLKIGPVIRLPHTEKIPSLSKLLYLQAINSAENKNSDLAVQSVLDIGALAQSLRNEPLIISQLRRTTCWNNAIAALEYIINRITLNEKQIRLLQRTFAKADDQNAYTRAVQGELCWWMNLMIETPEERRIREEEENMIKLAPPEYDCEKEVKPLPQGYDYFRKDKVDANTKREFIQEGKRHVQESRLPYSKFIKL